MRFYLSSFRLGNHPEQLTRLVDRKRAAIICNACDLLPPDERVARVKFEKESLQSIGLEAEELDLRDYYGSSARAALQDKLRDFGLVWVRGGNTFVLRRAMKLSGFDNLISEMLNKDEIVYAGYSAGICVLAASLKGLELADDPSDAADEQSPEVSWDGLGLLPYAIAPHYQSNHPESDAVEKLVAFYQEHGIPHRTLRDGQAIMIDGERMEVIG